MIIGNSDGSFSIDCTFQDGHLHLAVMGQLVTSNAALVRSLLSGDAALYAESITIDLTDVDVIDDGGLTSVVSPVTRLRSHGHNPLVRLPLHSFTRSVVRSSELVASAR